MDKICITGAGGFIGRPLMSALIKSGKTVRGFIRNDSQCSKSNISNNIIVGDITQWRSHARLHLPCKLAVLLLEKSVLFL